MDIVSSVENWFKYNCFSVRERIEIVLKFICNFVFVGIEILNFDRIIY